MLRRIEENSTLFSSDSMKKTDFFIACHGIENNEIMKQSSFSCLLKIVVKFAWIMVSLNEKRSKIRYIVQNKTEWVDGKLKRFVFSNIKTKIEVKSFHLIKNHFHAYQIFRCWCKG